MTLFRAARLNAREQMPCPRILPDNNKENICQPIFNALPFGLWRLIIFNFPSAGSLPPVSSGNVLPRIFLAKSMEWSAIRDGR